MPAQTERSTMFTVIINPKLVLMLVLGLTDGVINEINDGPVGSKSEIISRKSQISSSDQVLDFLHLR